MRSTKLCLSFCLVVFAVMVTGYHHTGRFFPWIHVFVLLTFGMIFGIAFFSEIQFHILITLVTVMSVITRVFVYLSPASMIGMDPDKFAAGVNLIMETGVISVIADRMPIYTKLSALYTFSGILSFVTGLEGDVVLLGIPIMMGVLLPLTAAAITLQIKDSASASLFAGGIAAFTAIGVLFSYWPVPQVLAVLVWFPILLLLVIEIETEDRRASGGVLVCLTTLIFAHKISLFLPVLCVGGAIGMFYLRSQVEAFIENNAINAPRINLSTFVLIFVAFLTIQWIFLTNFFQIALVRKVIPLLVSGTEIVPVETTFKSAVRGLPVVWGILVRRSHLLVLLPLTSLAGVWVWMCYRGQHISLVVATAAVSSVLAAISVVGVQVVPARRLALSAIPAFAVLIAVAGTDLQDRSSVTIRSAVPMVMVLLLISQAVGSPIAPDYPGQPRLYLTSGEVEGKSFMTEHSNGPVAMDYYYAREQVDVASSEAVYWGGGNIELPGVVRLNSELLNATLIENEYDAILLREHTEVIRYKYGKYRLTWDPVERLSRAKKYQLVYDNGYSIGFKLGRL